MTKQFTAAPQKPNARDHARETGLLPTRPSALLQHALDDLVKIERSDRYYYRSSCPVYYTTGNMCGLDLAGCVLVETFGAPLITASNRQVKGGFLERSGPYQQNRQAMFALDYFGRGQINDALRCLGITSVDFENRPATAHEGDRMPFNALMDGIVADLEKAGL